MIYNDAMNILHEIISSIDTNFKWTQPLSDTFLQKLQKRHSVEDLTQNSSKINRAFVNFFKPYGSVTFRYSSTPKIVCEFFAYDVAPSKSSYLKSLINVIVVNKIQVVHAYENNDNQIYINTFIYSKLQEIAMKIEEHVNKKELVRYAIIQAFHLHEHDRVLIHKDHILITFQKHHDKASKKLPQEQRFDGLDEDRLVHYYNKVFKERLVEDFLHTILLELFQDKLDFSHISNAMYEKASLSYIKDAITDSLTTILKNHAKDASGLAGYIFRKHFEEVHKQMAEHILEGLYHDDSNIINFLQYYDGHTIKTENHSYTAPLIQNSAQTRWNITTMKSIVILSLHPQEFYEKIKDNYLTLQKSIHHDNDKVEHLKTTVIEQLVLLKEKSTYLKKLEHFINAVDTEYAHVKTESEKKQLLKKHRLKYKQYQKEYQTNNLEYLQEELDLKENKRNINKLDKRIQKERDSIVSVKADLKMMKKNVSVQRKGYKELLQSLTIALMQRKREIK
jgi:hypothetical protein